MTPRRAALALLAALALDGAAARAVEWPEANPQRPSFSSNAAVTATGALELEAGLLVTREREPAATASALGLALKAGLAAWVDVTLVTGLALDGDQGVSALGLGSKVTLRQPDDRRIGLALQAQVTVPPPAGEDAWGVGGAFIVSYGWDDYAIDANLVLDAAFPSEGDATLAVDPVITFAYPILGDLGGYAEVYAVIPTGGEAVAWVSATGLGYALFPNLVLDAAVDVGLNDAAPSYVFQVGLTASMYAVSPGQR